MEERLGHRILPLSIEIDRQVVVGCGGFGVVIAKEPAVGLQRFLVERLGRRILPLGLEVDCEVVVACGGFGVVISEESAADCRRLLVSLWAAAYFPWCQRMSACSFRIMAEW